MSNSGLNISIIEVKRERPGPRAGASLILVTISSVFASLQSLSQICKRDFRKWMEMLDKTKTKPMRVHASYLGFSEPDSFLPLVGLISLTSQSVTIYLDAV